MARHYTHVRPSPRLRIDDGFGIGIAILINKSQCLAFVARQFPHVPVDELPHSQLVARSLPKTTRRLPPPTTGRHDVCAVRAEGGTVLLHLATA
jgi:hypothetical protein